MVNGDLLYQKIKEAVDRRGKKADELWRAASGFNPIVSPDMALANLKNMANVVRLDLEEEARHLIQDLEMVFRRFGGG